MIHTTAPAPALFAIGLGFLAGARHHFFERDIGEITEFFADPARRELVLRTTDRGRELFRFLAAQLGVAFLAAFGGLLLYLSARTLLPAYRHGTPA